MVRDMERGMESQAKIEEELSGELYSVRSKFVAEDRSLLWKLCIYFVCTISMHTVHAEGRINICSLAM